MAAKKPAPAEPSARDPRPTVAERVAVIRRRMIDRTWHHTDADLLAEEWGVSLVLVRAHSAEASRQIEVMADPSQVKAVLDGLLIEAADAARQEERPAERAKALVAVVREGRELSGIGAHRDPRNDPKPTLAPAAGTASDLATLPPWERSKHKEPKPS